MRKIESEVYRRLAVESEDMSCCTSPESLSFKTTAELPGLKEGIVGQPRAVTALDFGLKMEVTGYNIFVSGPVGTGRTTYTLQVLKQMAETKPTPDDWCYVYNFQSPDQPCALKFHAGEGNHFREAIQNLVVEVEQEMTRQFTSEEYAEESARLLKTFNDRAEELWSHLQQEAREAGMTIQRSSTGVVTLPLDETGRPLRPEALAAMGAAELEEFEQRQLSLQDQLDDVLRQIKGLQRDARMAQHALDEKSAAYAIEHLFEAVHLEFPTERVKQYLDMMKQDMVQSQAYFHPDSELEQSTGRGLSVSELKRKYQVNVLVNHSVTTGAPVVLESNPTYFNLFGKVEYRGTQGGLTSDFTLVKPGALHHANGGYLVLHAQDLLRQPASWDGLKRALTRSEIRIDHPAEESMLFASSALRPEAIALDVKVILIGTPALYRTLFEYDEAFYKFFKVKVEFDSQMPRTDASSLLYANFVAAYTKKNGLRPFAADAVAKIIDYSARQSGNQHKLSTRFNPVIEVIHEANYQAGSQGEALVQGRHVQLALLQKRRRSDLIKEKVLELLLDGTIKVDTKGEKVGQINGLAVLNTGDFLFGQPHRITARTYIGRRGVINVERETAMSGHIHDKGLLILSGYLAGEFAQKRPLSVSATVVFEQTYSMIDGDSASSTELYALLSALSNAPIKQGIAVTGSVDQFGDVQPIGGVNEKIEGFFYVCQAQGLTGEQGVMIPHQNVQNLFLPDEVQQAIADGHFHIWAVKNVREGIEVLTGCVAGEEAPYEMDTIYGAIQQRLDAYAGSYGAES